MAPSSVPPAGPPAAIARWAALPCRPSTRDDPGDLPLCRRAVGPGMRLARRRRSLAAKLRDPFYGEGGPQLVVVHLEPSGLALVRPARYGRARGRPSRKGGVRGGIFAPRPMRRTDPR